MIGELQVVVATRLGDLADLSRHPDLVGKLLPERAPHPVVELADRERRIGDRSGDRGRLIRDDRELGWRLGAEAGRRQHLAG
jgi:hypothetical protein